MLDSVGKQSNWIGEMCGATCNSIKKDAKNFQDLSKRLDVFVRKETINELVRDRNERVLISMFC